MAHAVKVCDENCTITEIYMGAPTVFQYGGGTQWTGTYLFQTHLPWVIDNGTPEFGGFDPAPGVVKEIDVQQTVRPITVFYRQYDGTEGSVVIPALPDDAGLSASAIQGR